MIEPTVWRLDQAREVGSLEAAIAKAPLQTKSLNGRVYNFRAYAFGEEGCFVSAELRADVVGKIHALLSENGWLGLSIASPEPGGFPWASSYAAVHHTGVIPIRLCNSADRCFENWYSRKSLRCDVEGSGETVVLLDDVVSSGQTLRKAAEALREAGFALAGIVAVCAKGGVDLQGIEGEMGIRVVAAVRDDRT